MATGTLTVLLERVKPERATVNREAGVIEGVKILGRKSMNRREYSTEAMRQAAKLYEGLRVLIDHPERSMPDKERSVDAFFGRLKNVRQSGDAVWGDLHFVRSHPLAERICEMAESMPEQLGLSHNAEGECVQRDGKLIVEEVTMVRSVDLVLNPATNRGLFESRDVETVEVLDIPAARMESVKDLDRLVRRLVVAVSSEGRLNPKQTAREVDRLEKAKADFMRVLDGQAERLQLSDDPALASDDEEMATVAESKGDFLRSIKGYNSLVPSKRRVAPKRRASSLTEADEFKGGTDFITKIGGRPLPKVSESGPAYPASHQEFVQSIKGR